MVLHEQRVETEMVAREKTVRPRGLAEKWQSARLSGRETGEKAWHRKVPTSGWKLVAGRLDASTQGKAPPMRKGLSDLTSARGPIQTLIRRRRLDDRVGSVTAYHGVMPATSPGSAQNRSHPSIESAHPNRLLAPRGLIWRMRRSLPAH